MFETLPEKIRSSVSDLKFHKIARFVFKTLYILSCVVMTLTILYTFLGLPGQSDFETMYASAADVIHDTSWFVIRELAGGAVIAVAYLGLKVFDYLVYVQDTHIQALEYQIARLLHIDLMFGDSNEGREMQDSPRIRLVK